MKPSLTQNLFYNLNRGLELSQKEIALLREIGYFELLPNLTEADYYQILLQTEFINHAQELEIQFKKENIDLIRLKSFSLQMLIFPKQLGRRWNDVDFLILDSSKITKAHKLIRQMNFLKHEQSRWEAADNRTNYYKSLNSNVFFYIDLHEKTFWGLPSDFKWVIKQDFQQLRLDDSYLYAYLILNWAYQDGFVGFEKLLDIWHLMRSTSTPQWQTVDNIAAALQLTHVFDLCECILNLLDFKKIRKKSFSKKTIFLAKKIIKNDFLLNPYSDKLLFIYLKHYCRRSYIQAFHYDYLRILSSL